jgi:MSHA biogenesis protein MshQ
LVIPALYAVSAANPVRYYHVFDTYLGGSDSGCGLNVTGTNRIIGTYSGPCGSSTSLPASGVVESFRERNGIFSAYCAAGWNAFFANGAPNCSVLQANPLSNAITTTLQDTGIGIEYDFTAPGTYTFSYDFVVGTTAVPTYDHIEIRHDGSATLCPENMIVLACTSSTVPCPALSIVNTGTLTGSISFSPAAPGTSFTPATFSVGTAASTVNMTLQASAASAGTYTMFASALSKAPLNGTKCTNLAGSAASTCSITIANTPCAANFECLETGLIYNNRVTPVGRNPLYTKLVSTGFKFDVVALQASGAISTTDTSSVNVELIDGTSGSCVAPTALTGTSQALTFVAADNGRKMILVDMNLAAAAKKLQCRVRQTGVASPVTACSSDSFTVRPRLFSAVTSNVTADADGSGLSTTNLPILRAGGSNFSLNASTGVVGYDGTPKVDNSLLEWTGVPATTSGGLAAPGTGTISGTFNAAAAATGNNAVGTAFTYSEVGYFRFKLLGVYDDDFVTNSGSADVANGDCTNDASNVLVGGKYGCRFGNSTVSPHFGRFIPDRFQISVPSLTEACSLGLPSVTPFTYFGQDGFQTLFAITAQNSSGGTTKNYTGGYAKLNLTNYSSYQFTITGAPVGSAIGVGAIAPTGNWFGGATATSNVSPSAPARVTVWNKINRPTALSNEALIDVYVAPTDGEVPASTPTLLGSSRQRYGRMRLQNAYGSEMLDLPVAFYAEHRIGNLWVKNVDDSCTPIAAPTTATGLVFFPEAGANHLSAGETTATVSATGKLVSGDSKLKFSKPGLGNSGYFNLALPVPLWLQFPWRGGATQMNPEAKVKFGAYKKANEFIYLREVH